MSEINNTNWNYPTPIWFGLNRTAEIKLALKELSISRATNCYRPTVF